MPTNSHHSTMATKSTEKTAPTTPKTKATTTTWYTKMEPETDTNKEAEIGTQTETEAESNTRTEVEEEEEHQLQCAICREVYTHPKLLQCTHTFCQHCLQDLVGEASSFLCPLCRREIHVPSGGVAAFRENPYLRRKDLAKARRIFLCHCHAKNRIELYCIDCDELLCVLCLMSDHLQHTVKTLSQAAANARDHLQRDLSRLRGSLQDMACHETEAQTRLRTLQQKKHHIEQDILSRHALITASADRLRDKALASLTAVTTDIEERLSNDWRAIQNSLDGLLQLEKRLSGTLAEGTDYEVCLAERDIRCRDGAGLLQEVEKKTAGLCTVTVPRPVLRCSQAEHSPLLKVMEGYLGEVIRLERRECATREGRRGGVGRVQKVEAAEGLEWNENTE